MFLVCVEGVGRGGWGGFYRNEPRGRGGRRSDSVKNMPPRIWSPFGINIGHSGEEFWEALKGKNQLLMVVESCGFTLSSKGVLATFAFPVFSVSSPRGSSLGFMRTPPPPKKIRGLRRTTEICDLRESLLPDHGIGVRGLSAALLGVTLSDEAGRPRAPHMIFFGNPGTGKTAVARLLAKVYHELGILRKPKFLEVERMDLIGADQRSTISKTREVLDEARGGVLFVDEAYTLGMTSKRSRAENAGNDAMNEIMRSIDVDEAGRDSPLVILAGFPTETNLFLARHDELRRRFDVVFEFPDYTCTELAEIFVDLVHAKGFYLDDSMRVDYIARLLEKQTDAQWRSERNGRVSEMLLAGARTEVRKRIRSAQFDEQEVDPQLILRVDIETAMTNDLK